MVIVVVYVVVRIVMGLLRRYSCLSCPGNGSKVCSVCWFGIVCLGRRE